MPYADMTIEELKDWIDSLELECDGFEDGCTRLHQARTALSNMLTYEE